MLLSKIKMPDKKYFKASLDDRRKYFLSKNKSFKKLEDLLLSHLGSIRMIYTPNPVNPTKILKGQFINGNLFQVPPKGIPSMCHQLSYMLWKKNNWAIWTGYALSDDGLWREHSWSQNEDGEFLEVTSIKRDMYFGVKLTDSQSKKLTFT